MSSAEAFMCCRETGERGNLSMQGMMGRGKRGRKAAFSLFPSSTTLFLLFNYCYSY